jgi:hypothetical protein
VEEWREDVDLREREAAYLHRLADEVAAGRSSVDRDLAIMVPAEATLREGLILLDRPYTPARGDSLRPAVGWLWQLAGRAVPNPTWEELVASGNLALIRDDELRRLLTSYQSSLVSYARIVDLMREQYLISVEPFVQRSLNVGEIAVVHPERVQPGGPPADLRRLWGDLYAWNLMNTKLETIYALREQAERVRGVQDSVLSRLASLGSNPRGDLDPEPGPAPPADSLR